MKTKTIKTKSDFAKNLDAIFKDIIDIKIDANDSFKSSMDKFYAVMRKWGICQGTWTEHGSRVCNNAEWNMCFSVFHKHKMLSFDVWMVLSTPPEDLLAYGKKPEPSAL